MRSHPDLLRAGSFAHPRFTAAAEPLRPALIMADQGTAIDYGELVERADRAAQLFASLGLCEGDTIAILLENQRRYVEVLWAAKNSGLRYVCVSTHLNAADAAYIVADSGARLLVASAATADLATALMPLLALAPDLVMVDGNPNSYEAALERQPAEPLSGRRRGPSMLYSSGTTGRPKGVNTELPAVAPEVPPQRFAMLMQQYGFGPETVFINPGPFYHSAPNRFMMSVLRAGGTVIGFARFDAAAVLAAIEQYRATHGFFVPTMFTRLLALPEQVRENTDISSMRHAIHAAAPCPIEVKRRMIDWWGPVIDELYAGTEAFGHTFISSREWLDHPGSVGRPAGDCRLKIVDEEGRMLPPGSVGRIMMTNGLRIAYHGDAAKTAALYDADGYGSLGDLGYVDKDGFLYLTDRESHMIIAGGVNIYPQETEAVIESHPDVADVAVIGVPDEEMGEQVKAVIELRQGSVASDRLAEAIIVFCRSRLSLNKCPKTIDFVPTLPRNAMGKLVKRELKQLYWQGRDRVI